MVSSTDAAANKAKTDTRIGENFSRDESYLLKTPPLFKGNHHMQKRETVADRSRNIPKLISYNRDDFRDFTSSVPKSVSNDFISGSNEIFKHDEYCSIFQATSILSDVKKVKNVVPEFLPCDNKSTKSILRDLFLKLDHDGGFLQAKPSFIARAHDLYSSSNEVALRGAENSNDIPKFLPCDNMKNIESNRRDLSLELDHLPDDEFFLSKPSLLQDQSRDDLSSIITTKLYVSSRTTLSSSYKVNQDLMNEDELLKALPCNQFIGKKKPCGDDDDDGDFIIMTPKISGRSIRPRNHVPLSAPYQK
mmetsp:Transcript_66414/g.98431  ORF Transcript_66414/g.98431 Transcript_66414/m.98431 type:complete len:305 (-) Transcript_66414:159-1073(-)